MRIRCISASLAPRRKIPLAGYGHAARQQPWERIDAPLSIELLQFHDGHGEGIVIGSIDALFLGPAFCRDLRRKLGHTAPNLFLFATHTHNAPSLVPESPLLGGCDDAWYGEMIDATATAVEKLLHSSPLSVSISHGFCQTQLNINRRLSAYFMDYRGLLRGRFSFQRRIALASNPEGYVDSHVRCLFLENPSGSVAAVVWCFPAHAAFYPFPLAVSPDYPGAIREHFRSRFGPGCAVIFLPGFAGSAIPRIRMPFSFPKTLRQAVRRCLPFYPPMLPYFRPASYCAWTHALAAAVDSAFQRRALASAGEDAVGMRSVTVDNIYSGTHTGVPCEIGLQMHLIRLGEQMAILAGNGEILGEWDPLLGPFRQEILIKTGYLAGDALYIPTSHQLPEGGYEVDGFQHYFGLSGSFDPDITRRTQAAVRTLALQGN